MKTSGVIPNRSGSNPASCAIPAAIAAKNTAKTAYSHRDNSEKGNRALSLEPGNSADAPLHGSERGDSVAPVERASGARGDLSVVAELLPYLRPYLGRITFALLLIVAAKFTNLLIPFALKGIVDQLNVEPSLMLLPVGLLLAYGSARIGVTLFTELRQVVFARVMARATRAITLRVFRHLHGLSLKFHLARRTGGVARDIERGGTAISELLDWTLYTILPTAIEVFLVTVVLVWAYGWDFGFITLGTLAAYSVWTFSVTEWRTRFYRAAVEADTRASERAVDSLLNYETVKYFNNETHEATRYDENLCHLENAQVKAQTTLAALNLGQTAIISVGVTVMMWRAATGVTAGELTIGDLVLVNAYLLQLSEPLFFLGMVYREVKQALTNMERLFGLLDERQDVEDREAAIPLHVRRPTVSFEQVSFSYDSRREILHGIDFEIASGGTIAVVGHSGSGNRP